MSDLPRLVANGGGAPARDTDDDEFPRVLDIEIDPPVEFGGKTYTTLHFEEPTGDQIERAEAELAGSMSVLALRKYQHALVALCAGVPAAVVKKMRVSQIREASDFLSRYIGGGPPIGGI
jgi:hypothetical protein